MSLLGLGSLGLLFTAHDMIMTIMIIMIMIYYRKPAVIMISIIYNHDML